MSLDGPGSSGSGERVCVACGGRYPQTIRFCPSDGQALREESAPDESLVGRVVSDRYYIERLLGVGGMGVVYLAQQVLMSRRCALKVLRPEFLSNAEALGRFARGAQNAAQIVHPDVATVFDFGEVDGDSMYLAMEYVEGDSLGTVLENASHLSIPRTMVIVAQVAAALNAAHNLGIVHRDLKPENIMLVRSGVGDIVKVVDFGIARAIVDDSQRVTDSAAIIGTPAYMSPEQISGGAVDQRSDLYSLALLTCEMLTGKLPLSSDRSEIVMRFLQRPQTLHELRPSVRWPDSLQAVLDRALSVNPADRQADIDEFGREFMDACRSWRPGDAAEAVSTLSSMGMSVSLALSSDAIVSIATPTPQPVTVSAPRGADRRWAVSLATTALIASGVVAAVLKFGPGAPAKSSDTSLGPPAPTDSLTRKNVMPSGAPTYDSTRQAMLSQSPGRSPAPRSETNTRIGRTSGQRLPPQAATDFPRNTPTAGSQEVISPVDSSRTHLVTADSVPKPDATTKEEPVEPSMGAIRIGSRLGAMLIIGDETRSAIRTLETVPVPARDNLRIRLRLDSCADWDTLVSVRAGQTLLLGYRNPICPPRQDS